METQTRLSRHNKFISAENIVGIFSVSSDDSFTCSVLSQRCDPRDNTEHVKRVIRRDGEYTNNVLRRNKFIMTALPSLSLHLIALYTLWMWILLYPRE